MEPLHNTMPHVGIKVDSHGSTRRYWIALVGVLRPKKMPGALTFPHTPVECERCKVVN